MLNRLLSILVLSFVTCGAYAATVDNCTLTDCGVLKVSLDARISKLQAGIAPAFGSIVKMDETSEKYCSFGSKAGGICYMTQPKAIEYCASQQNHLPSAREIALNVQKEFGAKGIVESCGKDSNCYNIIAKNLDKSIEEFYFSYSGYSRPVGDLGNNEFWSSSIYSEWTDVGFAFSGIYGDVSYYYGIRDYGAAVRCAVGR